MRDLQDQQASHRAGTVAFHDSIKPIREFFNSFFSPMKFVDVRIDQSPFKYIIETPRGVIDIDDLSAGEKEVLNSYIRFHQLNPHGAVILFDEADAHLHPDLERRYLEVLRRIGEGNQLWLTTHSPEMMIAAGTESLYTVLKEPISGGGNQFVRVTTTADLHSALSEVMGSRGLVSFNQRIVFIEGVESSADREIYERLYPPSSNQVSFVPAGNSATVRKTAERVNELLSSAIEFQNYFAIVDGDITRAVAPPTGPGTGRLFELPVYHVENFLLDEVAILAAIHDMMGSKCPLADEVAVATQLKSIVELDAHIRPLASAMQDARLAEAAKDAWDSVYKGGPGTAAAIPAFAQTETDARLMIKTAVADGTWKAKAKGRDVLRTFCREYGLNYEHFRNLVITKLKEPPSELAAIMAKILA